MHLIFVSQYMISLQKLRIFAQYKTLKQWKQSSWDQITKMPPNDMFDWKHSLFKISPAIFCLHDLGLAFELKQLYVREWYSVLSPQDMLGFLP